MARVLVTITAVGKHMGLWFGDKMLISCKPVELSESINWSLPGLPNNIGPKSIDQTVERFSGHQVDRKPPF